jgi:hypothetical protein
VRGAAFFEKIKTGSKLRKRFLMALKKSIEITFSLSFSDSLFLQLNVITLSLNIIAF